MTITTAGQSRNPGFSVETIYQTPIIAGVEITTDAEGRFNLNALHRASGAAKKNGPSYWFALDSTKALIEALKSQTTEIPVVTVEGRNGGTFAVEQLAVAYANWISPTFYLAVINTFLEVKKNGHPIPNFNPQAMTRMDILQMAVEAEKENIALRGQVEEMEPKARFHDQVAVAEDAISVAEAAKVIGTGRNRLMDFLRQQKWVTRHNEPYQEKIEQGLLAVKLSEFDHPKDGLKKVVTPLVTGKGLVKLQRMHDAVNAGRQMNFRLGGDQ